MGENKKEEKGFFKKFFSALTGSTDTGQAPSAEEVKSPYGPKPGTPLDEKFAQNFTRGGGHFLYCEDYEHAFENLLQILKESQSETLFTPEKNLHGFLKKEGFEAKESNIEQHNVICTTCEALVAFNGSIMIVHTQTNGLRLSQLPPIHVVWARTSQIVENLSDAMELINHRYREKRATNICTLKGPHSESVLQASADSNKNRNLYLLLLDDV